MSIYSLYPITNQALSRSGNILQDCENLCKAGVKILQLREKEISTSEYLELALNLKKITDHYNVKLIINDRLDIMQACDAAGVHLGQSDLPCLIAREILGTDKIIGISCDSSEKALKAEKDGASYVAAQSFFPTTTKQVEVKGPQLFKEIKAAVKIPVIAIGGINKNNLDEVLNAGVENVAMISALLNVDDVEENARWFSNKISLDTKTSKA